MDTRKLKGTYRGIPVDGGLGETGSGKEQVAALFELTGEETKGVRLTWYGYFTDGTIESTHKALRAMGWQGSDLTELLDWRRAIPKPNECDLVIEPEPVVKDGQPVVDPQTGEAEVRARIRWVNPIGRLGIKEPLAADKAAAFAARLKGKLLQLDQSKGGPKANGAAGAAAPTPPAAPAKDPGDVPF